jgi:hypothetical protein
MFDIARITNGIAAHALSGRLDRALAGGARADTDRLLEARATQLTSRQTRNSLVAVLEADLDEAFWFHWQADVVPRSRQRELFRAKSELQQVIARLRDEREVSAQGIALLRQLLTDGRGPAYGHGPPGSLGRALKAAIDLLDP